MDQPTRAMARASHGVTGLIATSEKANKAALESALNL
jgi:hypothetical protein